ncbi:MAG TPA: YajG family lipoprotein [Candidatus Acidoferrales bacterium]|nr:YajG family lipoprotein [Candidatus Acidoferrales bacterium]
MSTEHIDLSYVPQAGVTRMAGADRVGVQVAVKDDRPAHGVAFKANGYGMEMAEIYVDEDIPGLIKDGIQAELTNRGYQIKPGGLQVDVALGRFRNHFESGFFSGTATADLEMNVTVAQSDNRVVFNKMIVAQGVNPGIQLADGENAKIALNAALQDAIGKIFADPDFIKALTGAGAPAVVG